jgi:hypothetical protein
MKIIKLISKSIVRVISLLLIILFIFWPAVYATCRYPAIFSAGDVILFGNITNNRPENQKIRKNLVFLYDDKNEYIFFAYEKSNQIIRINKSRVSEIIFKDFINLRELTTIKKQTGAIIKCKSELKKLKTHSNFSVWLSQLGEIRSKELTLIEPFGAIMPSEKIKFRWYFTGDARYFRLELFSEGIGEDKKIFSKIIDGNTRSYIINLNKDKYRDLTDLTYFWNLDALGDNQHEASLATGRRNFEILEQNYIEGIKNNLNKISKLISKFPEERCLVLVRGLYYASEQMYAEATDSILNFLNTSNRENKDYDTALLLLKEQEKKNREDREKLMQLIHSQKIKRIDYKTIKNLIRLNIFLLDFDNVLILYDLVDSNSTDKKIEQDLQSKRLFILSAKEIVDKVFGSIKESRLKNF